MYRIGIDVGGTFTDIVAVDDLGRVTLAKAASTPKDQSLGVMDGLGRLAELLGVDLPRLLGETQRIVHGTTVATNALLERKGARVALLTTAGHRDVLEMREGLKDERYNLRLAPPEPLVPRHLRLGVKERIRPDGRVETPLDVKSLDRALKTAKAEGAESLAVCYLHAYRDARHERATLKAIRKAMPSIYVSLSSEVYPQIKEFERVSTTVVNAYVGPALSRYLRKLGKRLQEAGYHRPVLIMLSHGGVAPIEEAVRLAAGTVLSGPAGGVAGSKHAAGLIGEGNLIPFDMGGTSTDISLIVDGEPALSGTRGIAGQRIALPSLDIASLGAGGGSIARVDAAGVLQVGPQSAGAEPGPACYGHGGSEPTVTDASVVLGYLDPERFMGGRARLDAAAAEQVIDVLARRLGVGRMDAAEGVHRVVNTRMAEGIRLVTVRRGVDPRRFALLSFGGAAGLHVTDLARQLDLGRVVVPRVASVLSAWGMLASDLRVEAVRTHIGDTRALDSAHVRTLYDELANLASTRLAGWFDGKVRLTRAADMRYGEQIFEIDVPLDNIDWQATDLMAELKLAFERRHEQLYTYALPDQDAVLVNAKVNAIGELPALPNEPMEAASPPRPPARHRRIYIAGWHEVPVYDFATVAAGQTIEGPALVESDTTTALLRAGDRAMVTPHKWLDIRVGGR